MFAADAVYDGPLVDDCYHSDVGNYLRTMERLLHVRVEVVHPGHDESFEGDLLSTICDRYLMRHGGIAETD